MTTVYYWVAHSLKLLVLCWNGLGTWVNYWESLCAKCYKMVTKQVENTVKLGLGTEK